MVSKALGCSKCVWWDLPKKWTRFGGAGDGLVFFERFLSDGKSWICLWIVVLDDESKNIYNSHGKCLQLGYISECNVKFSCLNLRTLGSIFVPCRLQNSQLWHPIHNPVIHFSWQSLHHHQNYPCYLQQTKNTHFFLNFFPVPTFSPALLRYDTNHTYHIYPIELSNHKIIILLVSTSTQPLSGRTAPLKS